MRKNKVLPSIIALVFFATSASATSEKPDRTLATLDSSYNGGFLRTDKPRNGKGIAVRRMYDNAFPRNSQKLDPELTQQLKLVQQFWSDREWHSDGERTNRILQKLNLSTQQSRQATAIRQKFKTERDNLYQQVKSHRQEMRTLLVTNASSDRLGQDYQETRSLLERLGNNRFEMMMQIRKILTTEQRVRLIDLMRHDRN